jgi:hypothetical protein
MTMVSEDVAVMMGGGGGTSRPAAGRNFFFREPTGVATATARPETPAPEIFFLQLDQDPTRKFATRLRSAAATTHSVTEYFRSGHSVRFGSVRFGEKLRNAMTKAGGGNGDDGGGGGGGGGGVGGGGGGGNDDGRWRRQWRR